MLSSLLDPLTVSALSCPFVPDRAKLLPQWWLHTYTNRRGRFAGRFIVRPLALNDAKDSSSSTAKGLPERSGELIEISVLDDTFWPSSLEDISLLYHALVLPKFSIFCS